jgi:hypothetical protein
MHVCAAAAIVTNSEPKSSLYYTESPNGYLRQAPNGLRYPRWGGRRDAVRLGKC